MKSKIAVPEKDFQTVANEHAHGSLEWMREHRILLGTGGPATRIVGELDEYGQPTNAKFEYQDWFKPWTAANDLSEEEEKTLLEFASQFWFGGSKLLWESVQNSFPAR